MQKQAGAKRLTRNQQLLQRLYRWQLRLYPRPFRELFAEEMTAVFTAALIAPENDTGGGWRLLGRELLELPLVLWSEYFALWRQKMRLNPQIDQSELFAVRWTARLFSLLLALFVLSLFIFNEDVRAQPNFPTLLLLFLSLGLLGGWINERFAAWWGLAGAPLLFVSLLLFAVRANTVLVMNWLVLIGVAGAMSAIFGLLGWLFASAARGSELAGNQPASQSRLRLILLVLLGGILLIGFTGTSFLTPVSTQIEAPSLGGPTIDNIANALRAEGVIVGIGSPPVTHEAFAVSGTILLLNETEIWLFTYEDVAAATVDAAAIYRGERDFGGQDLIQQGNMLLAIPQAQGPLRTLLLDLFGPVVGEA